MMSRRGLSIAAQAAGFFLLLPGAFAQDAQTAPVTRAKVEAVLPQFEQMVQQAIAGGQVPGLSIAIVAEDQVVYLKGFGLREIGKPEPVDADTVFQLASFSKPISATVVAAVVGDGKIGWDAKIADLDPSFRLSEAWPTANLTVTDLFSHRSGLPGDAGNELESLGFDRTTILERLRQVPLSGFRSTYSYSNFGITEGAVAVAKAEGMEWADLAETRLYKPLGMTATSSRYADFLKQPDRAALHVGAIGAWKPGPPRAPDAQSPAGGVSSTARDLAKWLRLELSGGSFDGKPLINAEALAATHVPLMERGKNPVNGASSFYGRGWNVEFGRYGLSWGHAGAFSNGARTLVSILPDQGLGIVVLANAFPTGLPEGLADSLFDLILTGKVQKDWIGSWNAAYEGLFGPAIAAGKARFAHPPANTGAALANDAYLGRYANAYFGTAVVSADKDGLSLGLGPTGETRFPLTHFDRDLFLMYPAPEMPELPSAVTFAIGSDGKASSIQIESLDDLGFGTLKRIE
ncbi:CubicO group peptidase, beta-lactamase class C family [Kaistia soli DSM 19436]|uniref:CubicO group peptidase, beta-lactamase class C family n=1 Tax=Kaistia soli DSM 19436 TaxID=1122133 RepID=A0A1M4Z590_9HYPH|nr:serine hydrolase [Kaistia soli]SHF13170.1 CubicO group peptidase, beta-lactamase class C family [Kaistia soli DSM 19436]